MSDNPITLKIDGYSAQLFEKRIVTEIIAQCGIDVRDIVEKILSEQIEVILHDKVHDEMARIVHAALSDGIIVSEEWEEKVERKPVADIVRQAASAWMTAKTDGGYNKPKKTSFEKIAEEMIGKELEKATREILKGVKEQALKDAQDRIAKVVAENLFNNKALPF